MSISCFAAIGYSTEVDPAFRRRLSEIEQLNPAVIGRKALVERCMLLIQDYNAAPCTALVMMRIAQLYEMHNPEKGFITEPEQVLEWYGKASQVSKEGTVEWLESNIAVAQRLRDGPAKQELQSSSRAIFEAVEKHVSIGSVHFLMVTVELLKQDIADGDFLAAESRCLRLLQVPPSEGSVSREYPNLEEFKSDAVRQVLLSFVRLSGSKELRESRIRAFAQKCSGVAKIKLMESEALAQLVAWKDVEQANVQPLESRWGASKTWFVWFNVAVVVVVSSILWFGKRRGKGLPK